MKNKYMEELLAQIREKHAKERVRREVEGHILDQKAAYMAQGLAENEAEEKAVVDMGDPVLTGTELDLIHKPRPAWGMLALAAVLCAAGVILQYAIMQCSGSKMSDGGYFFQRQSFHALLGFFVLCLVYLVDYTWIAKYSRGICLGILLLWSLMIVSGSGSAFGYRTVFISGTSIYISPASFLYLYIPAYGALLYSYRSSGQRKGLKAFLFLAAPICLALWTANVSMIINLSFILLALFVTAVMKGWLRSDEKPKNKVFVTNILSKINFIKTWRPKVNEIINGCFGRHRIKILVLMLFAVIAWIMLFVSRLEIYQLRRIEVWLHPGREPFGDGYVQHAIRSILNGSRLIGENKGQVYLGQLPHMSTDYMLAGIIGYFGILAAAALVMLIIMFGVKLLRISICQSNQLGMIMGLGCSLLFFVQSIEYILVNLTLLPTASLYLPLVSYSGSGMIQTCVLIGILLSIYRYQDIVSEPNVKRTVNSAAKM